MKRANQITVPDAAAGIRGQFRTQMGTEGVGYAEFPVSAAPADHLIAQPLPADQLSDRHVPG